MELKQPEGYTERRDSWRHGPNNIGPSGLVPVCREDWSIEGRSRWKTSWKQRLVIGNLMLADTLLAFLIWWTAHLLQSVWGQGPLTEVAVTTVVSNVAVWIGLRTLLGLYPGYGLDEVEKLRRHTYAVLANAASPAIYRSERAHAQ